MSMFKHTSAALIAVLGLTRTAAAQAPATEAPPQAQGSQTGQTCSLPEIVDQVPLEQVSGSDLMTVPVVVNGTTKQFLLDIGLTKPTSVSPELMAKLGLPEASRFGGAVGNVGGAGTGMAGGASFTSSQLTGAGGMGTPYHDVGTGMGSWVENTQVRISSLGIGNATGHHLQMSLTQKGEIGQSAPYAGYLTGDFFRKYDVELDFAGKRVTWLTPSTCTDPNQAVFWAHSEVAVVPVSVAKDGRYQMQASVGGHIIYAEFDTSSPNTLMRRDIAEQDVGLTAGKNMVALGDLKDGMGMQIYVSNFPEIIFAGGRVTAENVPVLIQDYSKIPALSRRMDLLTRAPVAERIPDLVIGMDVLQHLHMYVVPGLARVYVTQAGNDVASH
jgi:hypothetical protein